MPFTRAHHCLLPLVPLILLAFWPGYFGALRTVPFALHAHGLSAMLWIGLVTLQSWIIGSRHIAAHRSVGRLVLVAVPLFTTGALLAMQEMAALAAARADPFHATYGARLALDDLLALVAFLALTCTAVAQRRRPLVHGGAMLATVLLVLPPILTRLLPMLPGFAAVKPAGIATFAAAFETSQILTICIAVFLARRHRRGAAPFLFAAGATALQSVLVESFGTTTAWERLCFALLGIPAPLLGAVGLTIGSAAMWLAWSRPIASGRPATAAI